MLHAARALLLPLIILLGARPGLAADSATALADAGRLDEALERGLAGVRADPADAGAHIALSHVYRARRQPYDALEQADKARSLDPRNPAGIREYILALQQGGMAQAALRTAREHPDAVSPALVRTLRGDQAAELVKLASAPTRSRDERYRIVDRALAAYTRQIREWEALGAPAEADVLRARTDRLEALKLRARMREAVDDYEALQSEGHTPPDYVLASVGAAYLDLHRPEQARAAYDAALHSTKWPLQGPEKTEARLGLFYSLVESGQSTAADRMVAQALDEEPVWLSMKGVRGRIPNDSRLALAQTAALEKQYANDLAAADARLSAMVALAPRDVGQRVALAQVHRARGWPRRAESELALAQTQSPLDPDLIAGQGMTELDLREWRQADMLADAARELSPESAATRRLLRERDVHHMAELRVTANADHSSGSPVSGHGAAGVDSVLYSPPIEDNWRVFAGGGFAQADFEETRGRYRWLRAGAEWRARDLTAQAEVSTNHYGFGDRAGAAVSAAYDLSDQWQVGGGAAFRSRQTPLRALAHGIYGNRLDLYLRWLANETREWTLSVSPSRFSDGNERLELQLDGRERLYAGPRLTADLQLNVAASRNTLDDAPYFNPRSDLAIVPGASLTHTLYRRYDSSLEQTFTIAGGVYAQQGHGSGAIGIAGYALRYRFNDAVEAEIALTGTSRPYDGVRERDLNILASLRLRF